MIATMTREQQKVARRILAADGFLDLKMPAHALRELDKIQDAENFEASVYYLRGSAHKALDDFTAAIPWLEEAARMIPAPLSRFAWRSLGECYTAQGEEALAELAELAAETAEVMGEDLDLADEDVHGLVNPPDHRPQGRLENHPQEDDQEK